MNIGDIVSLKKFDPVVNLNWANNINEQERLLSNYIMTEDLANIFTNMLESITLVRSDIRRKKLGGDISPNDTKRAHILSGQYGTGKSYFLLMLNIVLEMKNSDLTDKLIERFIDYPELQFQLKYIKKNKKYFLVRINGENENEKEFKDVIQSQIVETLEENFDDVAIGSVYKKNLKIFEDIYLKDKQKIDDTLVGKNYDYNDIRANLFNYKKEGLKQFDEIVTEAIGYAPKIELDRLEDFIKDVNEFLSTKGYDEIVVIFDEFSAYLSVSMADKRIDKDLGQIQNIAQSCASNSSTKISFIASTHKDLGEMIGANGNSKKEELDKVFGRFDTHTLLFEQGQELLKNTIQIDKQNFKYYKEKYKYLIENLKQRYNIELEEYYPLHPATVTYLEPISRMYAQRTRTTFTFLKAVIREKFFIQPIEINNKLNLVTIADLYNYFEDEIEIKNKNLFTTYNMIFNQVKTDSDLVNYTKTLAIAYATSLTKTETLTELTAKDLKYMYQIENEQLVDEKLNPLVARNDIAITRLDGKYRMSVNTSGINIEELIAKEKDKVNANIIKNKIFKLAENRIAIKSNHKLPYNMGMYPMSRELDGEVLSISELKNQRFENLFKTEKDGKIIFIVPNFNEELNSNQIIDKYKSMMENLDNNICLAIPKKMYFNEEDIKLFGALKNIEVNDEKVANDKDIKRIIIKKRKRVEDKIRNKYLRKFSNLKNFTFIFGGGKVKDDIKQDIKLYEEILYSYYYKFPKEIKLENFNTRAPLNSLIRLLLDGSAELGKNDTSEAGKCIRTLMIPLDLIMSKEKPSTTEYSFKNPTFEKSNISREVMDIVENINTTFQEKYEKLEKAPYGFNTQMIDLYMLVTNKLGRTYIENINTKRPLSLDVKSICNLSNDKKNSEFRLFKNENTEIKEEVRDIWLSFGKINGIKVSARKVKLNGYNDFPVSATLGQEMKITYERLSDKESLLNSYGVKTGKFKTLVNKLNSVKNKIRPAELFMEVENIVNFFKKNNFQENKEELVSLISKLNELTKEKVSNILKIKDMLQDLTHNIEELNGYNDFKSELDRLHLEFNNYRLNDFLNIQLLDKIYEDTTKLNNSYESEFKRKFEIYYDRYEKLRNDLLISEKSKIKCLKELDSIKFKNITYLSTTLKEIESFDREIYLAENHVGDYKTLKTINMALEQLDENFKRYQRQIIGIFQRYMEEIEKLKDIDSFRLDDNFKSLFINLKNIENGNDEGTIYIVENVENCKSQINEYIDGLSVKNEKSIDYSILTKNLEEELIATGMEGVDFEILKSKFLKIIEKYQEKEYKKIKLD